MDSIQNYIATSKIAFTQKIISRMQCAFQAVSQQLHDCMIALKFPVWQDRR